MVVVSTRSCLLFGCFSPTSEHKRGAREREKKKREKEKI